MPDEPRPSAPLLDREAVALLLVDLQYTLANVIFEPERVIKNVQLLLRAAEALRVPVILTTQHARGLGYLHPEIARFARGVPTFDKTSFGCFGDANFRRHLKERAPAATTLLVAGLESHICVAQTVLGALEAGYLVHVLADATSSRTAANWQIGLARVELARAVISSTEMAIYELLGSAGTAEFRALLPLLK